MDLMKGLNVHTLPARMRSSVNLRCPRLNRNTHHFPLQSRRDRLQRARASSDPRNSGKMPRSLEDSVRGPEERSLLSSLKRVWSRRSQGRRTREQTSPGDTRLHSAFSFTYALCRPRLRLRYQPQMIEWKTQEHLKRSPRSNGLYASSLEEAVST